MEPHIIKESTVSRDIDQVLVAAIFGDSAILVSTDSDPPTFPTFTFKPFEPLEAVVKSSMLLECGALVERSRLVGSFGDVLVYAALVAAIDRIAPPPRQRTVIEPLEIAARRLHAQFGDVSDLALNGALALRQRD